MDSVVQSESQQVVEPGRDSISVPGKGRKKPLSQLQGSFFVLFRPTTDWTRSTHVREGNLLYPSTNQMFVSSRNAQNVGLWPS